MKGFSGKSEIRFHRITFIIQPLEYKLKRFHCIVDVASSCQQSLADANLVERIYSRGGRQSDWFINSLEDTIFNTTTPYNDNNNRNKV